jgi:ribosomal protein S12 methylthiotransferase accessory factor
VLEGMPSGARLDDRPEESTPSFEGDLAVLLAKLARVGLDEVIVVDLTHEEVGIPVARVIVPGLEGYMFQHYSAGARALAFCDAVRASR